MRCVLIWANWVFLAHSFYNSFLYIPTLSIDSLASFFYLLLVARKNDRIVVTLECTEARKLGETPSRYITKKNKKNTTEKLELRKYNPYLKRVTVHKEVK